MKGIVKFYLVNRNYGFISGEDNKEYFVCMNDLEENPGIHKGQEVEFIVVNEEKGLHAKNVKPLKPEEKTW